MKKNISYYELANYIDGYVYCHEKSVDSKEYILSSLQKMLNLKNFTENNKLANYICKYFSIDLNLLKCGIGYKYKINFDKTENLINKILEPCLDESDKKEYENYKNFVLESDQAFSELLLNKNVKVFDEFCYDTNTELLKKEKVCLWDFDYLKIMIMKLSVKEQLAVFSLIEQLEK